MAGCRDCKVCTRSGIVKLVLLPLTIVYHLLIRWWLGFFMKKCPSCGHFLIMHRKRADGSFKD